MGFILGFFEFSEFGESLLLFVLLIFFGSVDLVIIGLKLFDMLFVVRNIILFGL